MIGSAKFRTIDDLFVPPDLLCSLPAWAVTTLVIASAAITAVGAISQGNAARDAAASNADANRRRAAMEEQQGQLAYARTKRQGLIDRGRSLAALSGANVDATEGSPLDLLSQQAKENEFQAERAKFEHDERAWAMRMGAIQQDQAGSAALSSGYGKAAGAVFNGLAAAGMAGSQLLAPAKPGLAGSVGSIEELIQIKGLE